MSESELITSSKYPPIPPRRLPENWSAESWEEIEPWYLELEEREIEWAKKFFTSNSLSRNKKTVLVAPISSLEIRDWGIEKFALLCRNLTFENNIQISFLSDRNMAEASVWPYGLGIAVVIGLSILVQSLRKKRLSKSND